MYGWKNLVKYVNLFTISFILMSTNPTIHSILEPSKISYGGTFSCELCTFTYSSIEKNSSDFIVGEDEEVVIKDRVFKPEGDIIVKRGGRLILQNTGIIFNHSGFYEHGILLKEDSTFEAYDSHIMGLDNLFFFRAYGASLMIQNTTFRRTHMVCEYNTRIQMVHSYLWALHCLNDTTVEVVDSHLCYLILMGNSSAKVDNTRMIEIILYDSSRVSVSDTTLRFIFYFDEGRATISNCTYEDEIRFAPKQCDLTIRVLDEENHDPVSSARVSLNRTREAKITVAPSGSDGVAYFDGLEEGDYLVEVESEGYTPLSIRVSLLNDDQVVTLFISKMETKREGSLDLDLSILVCVILFTVFLVLILRTR